MAFRTVDGKHDKFRLQEQEDYNVNLDEFCKEQPGYQPGIILPSYKKKFDEMHKRPFPTWLECCAIHDAFVELAIVYFCQLFNFGQSQEGQAAKNDKNFRDEYLDSVLSMVFSTQEEMEKFNLLKTSVLTARDKVIGHSDAEAYSIIHSDKVSIKRGPNISWRDIDFEFWYSFLERMINITHGHADRLKIQR